MNYRHSLPIDAYFPAADRAGPNASGDLPEWLVQLLTVLAYLARRWAIRAGRRHFELGTWIHERPDLPLASTQALAASIRGPFGRAIEWMCRRRSIGPGHKDWPELSRAIVRFGGSVAGFRAGLPACGLQWWENPEIVPGLIGETPARPAAEAIALLLSRQAMPGVPPAIATTSPTQIVPADAQPAVTLAPCRLVFARTATDPPTGPPVGLHRAPLLRLIDRGQNMAGPAVLIRADAMPRQWLRAA